MRPTQKIGEVRGSGGAHGERKPHLGYLAIQAALSDLGHEVGRGTIAEILARDGMEPAPERKRKTTGRVSDATLGPARVEGTCFPFDVVNPADVSSNRELWHGY